MNKRGMIRYALILFISTLFILGLVYDLATAVIALYHNGESTAFLIGYIIGRTGLLYAITHLTLYYAKNKLKENKQP